MSVLDHMSFKPARDADSAVPDEYGVYAIRLAVGSTLPEPFQALLVERASRLIYIGKADKQTLLRRLLRNELRARGNGTFVRSIGAVLGYRPPFASLAGRKRTHNYRFQRADRLAVVEWINANLEVSWAVLEQPDVHRTEVALIREHTPLLNLQHNPRALPELEALRLECRTIAAGMQARAEAAGAVATASRRSRRTLSP